MFNIHRLIQEGGFHDSDIINADETGINYGVAPRYQYVERGTKRGAVPASDTKARFTAMITGSGLTHMFQGPSGAAR